MWLTAGLLFAAVAGVAAWKVWPLLNPKLAQIAPLDPDCDLRAGPCTGLLPGGGRITFGITPRSIPVIQPLRFDVTVEGVDARSAEVDLQGVDMNMGFNRPQLQPAGKGHFSGEAVIPVCVRNAMEWEARVLVETDQGLVAAPFRFITVKPGIELPQ
ncbi:MAG TPA: hypothetical protein ENK50_07160 [Sedimenticola sp.]|nr:hypothetical protein [Sedimenticola sp.]